MSRWAPDARLRLENAALDLFLENGYEDTTVAQIADRAGLNRATFFRHFNDKQEVMFAGEDVLAQLFADGIRAAPTDAALVECLQAALTAVGEVMTPHRRSAATRRLRIVKATAELQERGQFKHARIAAGITDALRERGTEELTARLVAEIGVLAFTVAFDRWLMTRGDSAFVPFAADALSDLQTRATRLHIQ